VTKETSPQQILPNRFAPSTPSLQKPLHHEWLNKMRGSAGTPEPTCCRKPAIAEIYDPATVRWLDEVRNEVLARLLELNARRAEEEKLAGAAKPAPKGGGKRRKKAEGMRDMFEE
jgi:hypothetical protein